jgi:hypothetical protein
MSGATTPASPPAKRAAEPQAFPAARDESAPAAAPAAAAAAPASRKAEAANEPSIVAQSAPVERSTREAALAPKPTLKSQQLADSAAADASAESAASGTLDAVSARAKMRASLPTEQWIALMRRLLNEQHFDELAKELAAFRTLHADANALLPADLRNFQPPAAATR